MTTDSKHVCQMLLGSSIADSIRQRVTEQVKQLKQHNVSPQVAVVIANDNPAVLRYESANRKNAEKMGIGYHLIKLDTSCTQERLERVLEDLASNSSVHGIVLSLPIYKHLDTEAALSRIPRLKDIDGLTAANLGLIASDQENRAILTATPMACIHLAETVTDFKGVTIVIVGCGRTVGWPLAQLLKNRDATVLACNAFTHDLDQVTQVADVIIACAGSPGLIKATHVHQGQVVIDAGISVVNGKVVGDVDAQSVQGTVKALSPVPGGVGPITSSLLFQNLLRAIELQSLQLRQFTS